MEVNPMTRSHNGKACRSTTLPPSPLFLLQFLLSVLLVVELVDELQSAGSDPDLHNPMNMISTLKRHENLCCLLMGQLMFLWQLRDIEILVQGQSEVLEADGKDDDTLRAIQKILYSTEVRLNPFIYRISLLTCISFHLVQYHSKLLGRIRSSRCCTH